MAEPPLPEAVRSRELVGGARAIALLVLLAGATGRSQAQAIPARIVSTSPSITETLFALGLGDRVVGVSIYCRYPAAVSALPKVGTFLKPDAETIARLKPDLVFVHKGPNNVLAQLGSLGIKTAVVDRGRCQRCLRPSGRSARPRTSPTGENGSSASSMLISIASRPRSPDEHPKDSDHRRPPHGHADRHHRRRPWLLLARIAAIAGGVERAGVEQTRVSAHLDGNGDEPCAGRHRRVGEMGESPADSDRRRQITEGLWRGQTLVKAVRDGGVHAVDDEAFVVPGPRIVDVARTWPGGSTGWRRDDIACSGCAT